MQIEIANPMYDVAFKYMLEDNKAAKIFLSALTALPIISLEPLPQELVVEVPTGELIPGRKLSVYRLDFSARVRLEDGSERIIVIELQRTTFLSQTMRFRKYLGKQYLNDRFFQWLYKGNSPYKQGIPVLPIYFLGEKIDIYEGVPVILVQHIVKNRQTETLIPYKHTFIESLFHEGIIVHVPGLQKNVKDELEQLLTIFDPSKKQHTMHVNELEFPRKFQIILRRLQAAAQEKTIRDKMTVEDEFMQELQEYEDLLEEARNNIQQAARTIEEATQIKKEATKTIEEAARTIEEATQIKKEARRTIEEAARTKEEAARTKEEAARTKEEVARTKEEVARIQEEMLHTQEEAAHKQDKAIRLLLSLGMTKQEIALNLGLSEKEIQQY